MKLRAFLCRISAVAALAAAVSPALGQDQTCWSIARFDGILRRIDPDNGATLQQQPLSLPGQTIEGGYGLARAPAAGDFHGLLQVQGQSGAVLATIDETTGLCSTIGNTGDSFAGIAFDSGGTLYGLTGSGAITPRSLFFLSTVDASTTFIVSLPGGGSGDCLAFNPDDGLLYRASGGIANGVFQTIDPGGAFTITNIPMSGQEHGLARALKYDGSGAFLLAGAGDTLFRITSSGVVSLVGPMDHTCKGLASMPAAVPTMSQWSLIFLCLLLLLGGGILFRRGPAVERA